MSLRFIKSVLYALRRQYGCKVDLVKYVVGQIDYTKAKPATYREVNTVDAIALPLDVIRQLYKSSTIGYDKNERHFIIDKCDESWVKDSISVIYKSKRYNIKESKILEDIYFHVICTSVEDEPHE